MGEARPPCRVDMISDFHQRCDGGVLLMLLWDRGIDDRVCGLRVISHGGGVRGAGQACSGPQLLAWHSVGNDGAFRGWLLLAPLPGCGGVVFCCVCCLRALFVLWWCSLRRIMYECFFFLYDVAVLLPFISKKKNVTPLF